RLRPAISRSQMGTPCSSPSVIRSWMSLSRWPPLSRDSQRRGWCGACSGAGDAAPSGDARLPRRLGPREQFHVVAVGVFEIDPAAAGPVIDLAWLPVAGIGPVADSSRADAVEGRIELVLADQECIMLAANLVGLGVVKCHFVAELDRYERAL